MIIRNITDPNFSDTVLGVKFENGISTQDFNQFQIDRLRSIGRFEFEIIANCKQCLEYKLQIEGLKKEIEGLKSKKK